MTWPGGTERSQLERLALRRLSNFGHQQSSIFSVLLHKLLWIADALQSQALHKQGCCTIIEVMSVFHLVFNRQQVHLWLFPFC